MFMAEHSGFEKLVAEAKKNIREISLQDSAAKSRSGEAVIVDVREKAEWDEEHIPGAIHLSRGPIELDIEEKFPDENADDHLPLRRWRSFRARGRKPAKDGLQKRPLHGRRLQSLESRWVADDHITQLRKRRCRHKSTLVSSPPSLVPSGQPKLCLDTLPVFNFRAPSPAMKGRAPDTS